MQWSLLAKGMCMIFKEEETQGDKASLVVSVKDKRRGIDTELLPRLFTKLCQSLKSAQGWDSSFLKELSRDTTAIKIMIIVASTFVAHSILGYERFAWLLT